MKNFHVLFSLATVVALLARSCPAAVPLSLNITANQSSVSEGRMVVITAALKPSRNAPRIAGVALWPYLDGKQWGASEKTNQAGIATLLFPLPLPGIARIQVALTPPVQVPSADWIWSYKRRYHQNVYFQRRFRLDRGIHAAGMLIVCDDRYQAWLNGHRIGSGGLWRVDHLHHLGRFLKPGENLLSVEGHNVTGPAGLLARFVVHTATGTNAIFTNGSWRCFAARPAGWPAAAGAVKSAQRVQVIAPVGGGVWEDKIHGWPGLNSRTAFPVGQPPSAQALLSNTVRVRVRRRRFKIITDPRHLVGMDYETWFGPGYAYWGGQEAVPVLGYYTSLDPLVLRQQTLWFDEMGINFVELDWTNNLVHPFPDGAARECIAATNALFHLYAKMAQHPQIVIMVGPENNLWLNNRTTPYVGPWFRKQLNYLYRRYIRNPKYRSMYLTYKKKPLLLCYLNGPRGSRPPSIDDPRFTIRYVSAWLQTTKDERYGAWSWYDQKATPTYHNGKVEALTVTDGYPGVNAPEKGLNNWLSPEAGGKNYGLTYRTQWRVADRYRPRFLFLCQWNEFEPPDQYNVNLSNDMEPTLLTEKDSTRPSGWGFFYLDLTRREIQRYHRILTHR